jgi:formylglycine-generating enzyme required for sulfatase activity
MSHREVRGSFYSAARENESQPGLPSSESRYVSFRLAHDGDNRVRRGGCWFDSAEFARVAYRFGVDPASRVGILGFRLARTSP